MIPLLKYICESLDFYGFCYTISKNIPHQKLSVQDFTNIDSPEKYIEIIQTNFFKKELSESFKKLIELCYEDWVNKGQSPNTVPFRFNKDSDIKLDYDYEHVLKQNFSTSKSSLISGHTAYYDIGPKKIIIGKGLGGGKGGYTFENELCKAISIFVLKNFFNKKWTIPSELNNISDSLKKTLENIIHTPELQKAIKKAITDYDDFEQNLNKYIFQPKGSKKRSTKKNTEGLPSVLCELNEKNDDILSDSGRIISDITIGTNKKTQIYLSVKQSRAQLSGITVSPSLNGKRWMDEIFDNFSNFKDGDFELPNSISGNNFNTFFKGIGIDPKDLILKINSLKSTTEKVIPIKIWNSYDKKKLGKTIQNIIGGNYWYISPKECFFVSSEPRNYSFEIKNIEMISSGRTINIYGSINNVPIKLVLRTSSTIDKYPTRLFPVISDLEDFMKNTKV